MSSGSGEELKANWETGVSVEARATMEFWGDFGPTLDVRAEEVKGYPDGYERYLSAKELRKMAQHFIEVADWLECRALSVPRAAPKDEPKEGTRGR